MKDLLNAGQVLGRSEMRKIMAGSGECALYCGPCTLRCGITPCEVSGGVMTCQGRIIDCDNAHC